MKLAKISNLLLFLILAIYTFLYLKVASTIPIDGDGALHASTIQEIVNTGTLVDFHPLTIAEGNSLLPVFYPKLFYTLMSVISVFDMHLALSLVVPFFGILIGLFVYLISKEIFKSPIAHFVSLLFTLSSYGLISNSLDMFRMETMVVLLGLSSFYSLLKYCKTKHMGWLVVSTVLFSTCIGTKQQSYLYLPLMFLVIFFKLKEKFLVKIFTFITFCFFSFLIAAPILIDEFRSTGTFFYPGVPYVASIEKVIAKPFNIKLYETGEGWKRYAVGSDRIVELKKYYGKLSSHIAFLSPVGSIGNYVIENFFTLGVVLGALAILPGELYLLVYVLSQQAVLFIQPLERYFLLNQIIGAMLIGGGVDVLNKTVGKNYKLFNYLIIMLTVLISINSTYGFLRSSSEVPNYEYGMYAPGRLNAYIEAGEWLDKNTSNDSVLITPRTLVFSYYSKRRALWLNQLGGKDIYEAFLNNDVEKIHLLSSSYKNSYIVIPTIWILNGEADGKWIPYIEAKTVSEINRRSDYFAKVYTNNYVTVFKNI